MFPKSSVASITGIGGMAGGIGAFIINKGSGALFDFSSGTTMADGAVTVMTKDLLAKGAQYVTEPMQFFGFEGIRAGYFIIFCICAVAYLIGWLVMKALVPAYKPIVIE
jgi:ACS family hexuronate transporter-like MFS transporter